jgi:hypothetical protein
MKRALSLIIAVFLLGACSREAAQSIPKLGDRTLTVDEFLKQPDLRKEVSAACHNDPGHLGLTPNCVNVRRADHLASMGTSASLHIDLSP